MLINVYIDTDKVISELDHMNADAAGIACVENVLAGCAGGVIDADFIVMDKPVHAVGSLSLTGTGTVADETFTICGVVFTAKASGATGPQFDIDVVDSDITATNMAAAVTASIDSSLVGVIDCTASGSVVSFTATYPGLMGNGLKLVEAMTDCTLSAIAGGTNGTVKTLKNK